MMYCKERLKAMNPLVFQFPGRDILLTEYKNDVTTVKLNKEAAEQPFISRGSEYPGRRKET